MGKLGEFEARRVSSLEQRRDEVVTSVTTPENVNLK